MTSRARAFAIVLLFCSTAALADVEWTSGLEAGLARAQREDKPLLVHLRASCGRCNRSIDEFLAEAEKHQPIVLAYRSFVLCRVESGSDLSALQIKGADRPATPSLALLTPGGSYLTVWTSTNLNLYTHFLFMTRLQGNLFKEVDQWRRLGKEGRADLAAGNAMFYMTQTVRAATLFERARKTFEAEKEEELEEFAAMRRDAADYLAERDRFVRAEVTKRLEWIGQHGKSRLNRASAYFQLAVLQDASNQPVYARRSYRRAYETGDPASDVWRAAKEWLVADGSLPADVEQKAPATIRVIPPERATVSGRVELVAECAPQVARVAWFLDGAAVASDESLPFTARVDLGRIPRLHAIHAVAYDIGGHAIGESRIALNDRVDAFRVSIVSPVADRVSGETTIEAEAEAPAGGRLEKVELYWNEEKIAAVPAPPFRAVYQIPPTFGFLRAVATLDDGRTAEDTRVVNSGVLNAPVDVHAVAFPVTVTTRNGSRIDGLRPSDFVVTDDDRQVEVTLQGQNEPSTIGLAIDSSASMKLSLLDVMETATEFLDLAVSPADKVFLMTFDDRPHMIHTASTDRQSLRSSVLGLLPAGYTSLYDAIAFGLQQFTGMPGKRALLLLTDGLDVASEQSGTACLRMAREIGVPVYIVVTGGVTMNRPIALHNIAESTGGAILWAPKRADLTAAFEKIRDEVRGQYLMVFNAPAAKPGSWRKIRVEVPGRRVTVRTISGYYAR